jgi:hypothetical protein
MGTGGLMPRYLEDDDYFRADAAYDVKTNVSKTPTPVVESDERTRLQKFGIPDVDPLAALQKSTTGIKPIDPDLVRDPKTGLSPAQIAANKAVAEAAAAQGLEVTSGAKGFTDRVSKIPVKVKDPNANFPKAGTILRYKPGRTGFRIPVIADGKGGEIDGAEVADPGYDSNLSGDGEFEFVGYEYNADFTQRRAKKFNKKTGQFSYDPFEPNPMSKEQFDKINAQKIQDARDLAEKRDSYKLLETTMRSYGFTESELQEILNYMQKGLTDPNMGPNQMLLDLRNLKSYQARFAGNEERRGRGLNALSEADYLQQERDFSDTLRQYGVQRFATRGQFATFIGNAVSNAEVGRRAKIAVERLQMGDPAILRQFRIYYPNITDSDIVSYFLNPKEVLPELEAKTTTSEIGATAKQYGLNADLTRASELQRYGVDLAEARVGYQAISERLPRGQELSKIYKESGIDYSQDVAEEEQYKGTASAKRAREKLYGLEAASFSKETGLTPVSLTSRRSGAY